MILLLAIRQKRVIAGIERAADVEAPLLILPPRLRFRPLMLM